MKKIFFLLFMPTILFGQSWRFFEGENPFDGKFIAAGVIGKGYDSPYLTPKLVLNKFADSKNTLYLKDTGYYPDKKDIRVEIKFDVNGKLYELWDFWLSRDKKTLALESFIDSKTEEIITLNQMLNLFTSMSKIYLRVSDDYNSRDFNFSLSGSNTAIKKIIPNLKTIVSKEILIKESQKELDDKILKRNYLLLNKLSNWSITTNTYEKFEKFIRDKTNKKYYKKFFSDFKSDSIYLKPKSDNIKVTLSIRDFELHFVSSENIDERLINVKLNDDSYYLKNLEEKAEQKQQIRDSLLSQISKDFTKYKFSDRGLDDIAKYILDNNLKYKDTYITADGVSSFDYKFGYIKVGLILEDGTKRILPNQFYRTK